MCPCSSRDERSSRHTLYRPLRRTLQRLMYGMSALLSACRGSEVSIQAMALRLVAAVVAGLGEGGRSSLTVQQDALRAADRYSNC